MKHPRALSWALAVGLAGAIVVGGPTGPAQAANSIQNAYDLYEWKISQDIAKVQAGFGGYTAGPQTSGAEAAARAQAAGSSRLAQVFAYPGSVVSTQVAAAKVQAAKSWKIAGTVGKPLVKGVGGAAIAVTGYSLGASIGNGTLELFGVDTQGAVCTQGDASEWLSVVTGTDCSTYGFAPQYVPNFDAAGKPEGFPLGNTFDTRWGSAVGSAPAGVGTVSVSGITAPAFAATGSPKSVTVTFSVSGVCSNNGFPTPSPAIAIWTKDGSGVVKRVGSSSLGVGNPCAASVATATRSITAAGAFDHLTFESQTAPYAEVAWYPQGHASWTPATSGDPDRTLTCSVVGSDGVTYSASSDSYKESAGPGTPECPGLPAGVVPQSMKLTESGAGSTPQTLYDQPVAQGAQDHLAAYPECTDGSCSLDLKKKSDNKSCFAAGAACMGWLDQTDRETAYQCTYGVHDVPLTSCYVYRDVFDPAARAAGNAYVDPLTGDRVTPGQPTSTPDKGTDGYGRPIVNPEERPNCFGAGWGDPNPVNWVMQPVQCAIEWAFVPRASVVDAKMGEIDTAWRATTIGQTAVAITGFAIDAPAGGCGGVVVNMDWFPVDVQDLSFMAACPGDVLEPYAAITRIALIVSFAVLGLRGVTANLGSIIGYRGVGGT